MVSQVNEASTAVAGQLLTRPVDRQVNNERTLNRTDLTLLEAN